MTTELDITGTSAGSFDETVADVERLTAEHGFRVLHVHDVRATLKEKGFEIGPYKIVEICNAKYAHKVIMADPKIGMMLPCRINVYTGDGGTIVVSGMRPTVLGSMFPEKDLGRIPEEVEGVIQSIIESVGKK